MTSLLVNEKQKNIQHGFASDIGTSHEQQDKNSHASTHNLELFGVFDGHGGLTVSEHCAELFPIELRKEI